MKSRTFPILFCLAIVVTFAGYPTLAKAQAIEDGLVGYWSFDKKDTDAKAAKDALGEHDGEIKGAPQIVEG